jgi:uncharacterized protein (DUF433 family)
MTKNRSQNYDLLDSLNAPAYSINFTSHLVGIPKWSVSRYLRGYFEYKSQVQQPPIIEQSESGSKYASFLDLIDLLFIKEFLKRGFTIQYLRIALEEAKKYLGTPHFARSEFFTSKNEIVLKLPKTGNLIALMTGGQLTIPEITEKLNDKLDFEDITGSGFVRRWYPKGKNGLIVIDPQISFGKPTIIGHSVPTSNIYDLYLGENENYSSVCNWFNIPLPKIETAVQFEHSLWM